MPVNDTQQSPYANPKFWKAYASLYWPELDHNEPLKLFARTLATNLPKVINNDAPMRVLALGFGFGGVELPVLFHLKAFAGRKLECVVIDSIPEPMHFASQLLAQGIDQLPKTDSELQLRFDVDFHELPRTAVEYAPDKNNFFTSADKGSLRSCEANGDRFHFIWDDLDWEPNGDTMCRDGKPISLPVCPMPSRWADRLRAKQSRPSAQLPQQFDLVIAAFSLFHIKWWRRPLYDSLEMLARDGLFLHVKVQGDEAIFEGRHGKLGSKNSNAVSVFTNGVFKDPRVREVSSKPRGASASRPFVVEEYLHRLESFGLNSLNGLDGKTTTYGVANTVKTDVYRALLTTKGFSTFKRIAESITESAYAALCKDSLNNAESSGLDEDQLDIDFVWSVHRVTSAELKKCPLHPEYAAPTSRQEAALASAYQAEYGINGAASIHVDVDDDNHEKVARRIGEKLAQQELLDSRCLALQLGFIPHGESRPHFFFLPSFALSELRRDRQLRQLAMYLSLLKNSRQLDDSSNTQKLITVVMSLFPGKPAIFVYELNKDHLSVTHRSARDYEEIRFHIPAISGSDDIAIQRCVCEWMTLVQRISRANEVVSSLDDLNVSSSVMTNQLAILLSLIRAKMNDPRYIKALPQSISSCTSLSPEARARMVKVCETPRTLFGALSLQCLEETEMVVFYPATYDVGGQTSARDLVIASYSESLADEDIERELHKYSQVFERIRFRRQEVAAIEKGVEKGIEAVEQRFGHELAKSFGPALSVINRADLGNIAFGAQLAEAALTYGIISTPTKKAVARCKKMTSSEVMQLAWRIHLLRDVFGETFTPDLLASHNDEVTFLWEYIPPLEGDLLQNSKTMLDNNYVRLIQLQYILLINGIKHHYRCFYQSGDDAAARVYKLATGVKATVGIGAIRVLVGMVADKTDESGRLRIEVINRVAEGWPRRQWLWQDGTPQALDTTCSVIHEVLKLPYDRQEVIAHSEGDGVFSCSCTLTWPTAK